MSRVTLISGEQVPLLARPFYAAGYPGPIGASLAQVPELMQAAMPLISRGLAPGLVGPRLKELLIVRGSALQGCRYCTLTHSAVALRSGVMPEEVRTLRTAPRGEAAASFDDPREASLLAWTDAVALGPQPVTDDVFAAVAEHFSEPEIVEVTMAIGTTILLNRYCTALALPVSASSLSALGEHGLADTPDDAWRGEVNA